MCYNQKPEMGKSCSSRTAKSVFVFSKTKDRLQFMANPAILQITNFFYTIELMD